MTDKQLKFLKEIHESTGQCIHSFDGGFQNITEQEVDSLVKLGFVKESCGDGYMGGLRVLELTERGVDIAKDYCDACECLPCDCHWGYE